MRRRFLLTAILITAGVAAFISYYYIIGFGDILRVLLSVDLPLALGAVLVDLLCIGLFALGWKLLTKRWQLGFCDSCIISMVGLAADALVPTASVSEIVVRISLASKRAKMTLEGSTASVLLHRLVMMLTFGVAMGVNILVFYFTGTGAGLMGSLLWAGALLLAFCMAVVYFLWKMDQFEGRMGGVIERAAKILHALRSSRTESEWRLALAERFHDFAAAVCDVDTRSLVLSALVLGTRWIVLAFIPYLLLLSLSYTEPFQVLLAAGLFSQLVLIVPVGIPGRIGFLEVSLTGFLVAFGIPADVAASATLLSRIFIFGFELALGTAAALAMGPFTFLRKGDGAADKNPNIPPLINER